MSGGKESEGKQKTKTHRLIKVVRLFMPLVAAILIVLAVPPGSHARGSCRSMQCLGILDDGATSVQLIETIELDKDRGNDTSRL